MNDVLAVILMVLAAGVGLLLSTLTFAARELSRAKLHEALEGRKNAAGLLDPLYRATDDLAFLTALGRLACNLLVAFAALELTDGLHGPGHWAAALGVAGAVMLVFGVLLPHAISVNFGPGLMARAGPALLGARTVLLPLVKLAHGADALMARLRGGGEGDDEEHEEYEAEILSYAAEGELEGAIDAGERRMIEQVVRFGDRTVDEAMTSRPDVVALPYTATLGEIRRVVIDSGHSRIPVYDGELDQIVGVLYARDLIHRVGGQGQAPDDFEIDEAMRPARFVFETMRLTDLLTDFRVNKVHIGIVRDEYGAVAGVITIEDVLEQLVGEISDEHEPAEAAKLRPLPDGSTSCDGRIAVADLNHELGLDLPEDEDYDTLAGFTMAQTGGIPKPETSFEYQGVRFKITAAEPHRVTRVRVTPVRRPHHPAKAG